MAEAVETCTQCETFVEFLRALPWCKQGEDVLVAVHKCTPEVIDAFGDHEVAVYPGGIRVKPQKSFLSEMRQQYEEGVPYPALFVWKQDGVHISYRRHKTFDYPYDTWTDPLAAAYEREQLTLPASHCAAFGEYHEDICTNAKVCPTVIPAQY
jgi:hypothetical protein